MADSLTFVVVSILSFSNIKSVLDGLNEQVDSGREPHARLLVGKSGAGLLPVAMAHASYMMTGKVDDESVMTLNHPDVHYSFPFVLPGGGRKVDCNDFYEDWKSMLAEGTCFDVRSWANKVSGDINKSLLIGSEESSRIMSKLSLKSYLGGKKVLIIWKAELINVSTANKLLKLIEEPPADTYIILLAESTENILPTIISRCQLTRMGEIPIEELSEHLVTEFGLGSEDARNLAALAEGDLRLAENLCGDNSDNVTFHELFVQWMRVSYGRQIIDAIKWVEKIDGLKREKHKSFLQYCLNFFRQCMLSKYAGEDNALLFGNEKSFADKFGKFVHGGNVVDLMQKFDTAHLHIERNANAKLVFLNLSIDMMGLLRKPIPYSETSN